jgi:integrase
VRLLYGRQPVDKFGPIALQVVIQKMVENGLSRGVVNQNAGRIKRMFKWGVAQEMIPATIYHALASVRGLCKGRTDAREMAPVRPIADVIVDATLVHVPEVIADMIAVQRHTGMRPAEVCLLRPIDIDRSDEVWVFRPAAHKTEHHERERVVFIGPRAQRVLLKYLARDTSDYCFRPCDSEAKRLAHRHAARRVPLRYGNSPGTNRQAKPKRSAGQRYDTGSYRRAIHRGCDKAFRHPTLSRIFKADLTPEQRAELRQWQREHRWSPNRLRHNAGTRIRKEFGLEASRVVLGHSDVETSAIYAERDTALGLQVARKIG